MTPEDSIVTFFQPTCILCGGEGTFLYQGLRDALFRAPGFWSLKKCINLKCRLVWLDPLPKKEELAKAYRNYHTHLSRKPNLNQIAFSLVRRVLTLLELPVYLLSGMQRERVQAKYMFLAGQLPGKLLDVGCGGGRFLNRMKKKGWEVEGIERDPLAVERVSKKYRIPVTTGTLPESGYPSGYFDVITLSHMIEHEHDPLGLIHEIYRILKPGGLMVIVTPNCDGLAHRKFGKYWRGLEPPRHLYLYSADSLRLCLGRSGFDSQFVSVETLSSDSAGIYLASFELESGIRKRFFFRVLDLIRALYFQYREYFIKMKEPQCGEDIVLVARKNIESSFSS
ncbi:MAG: class I SAM-dependent methyltransferase [Nitrospirae bacterium]|nr:class I SAM-dependent methyltransferase [Nitrospirota bacterium]